MQLTQAGEIPAGVATEAGRPDHKFGFSIRPDEFRWLTGMALLVLFLSTLPYVLGATQSAPGSQFSGLVIGVEDGYSYLAKMEEGRAGHWLFYLAYTPESHRPELFFIFYLMLGKLAGLAGLSNVLVFNLSKVVAIPFGVFAFYYFATHFAPGIRIRRMATLIFCFTGGLGWLWLLLGGTGQLGKMPVDLWVPDASFFLAALSYPHLALAQGLLFLLCVFCLKFLWQPDWKSGVAASVCGLAVSLIHPYSLPVIGVVLALFVLVLYWRQPRELVLSGVRLLLIAMLSLPYLVYVWIAFNNNPAFSAWRQQSLTWSPPVIHYLLGFGLTLVFAGIGLWNTRHEHDFKSLFFLVWVISVPFLVYIPIGLQRRFLDGYQAPLAICGAIGLVYILGRIESLRLRRIAGTLILVVMSVTNIVLLSGGLFAVHGHSQALFVANSQVDAADWLAAQAGTPVVLASYMTGNYLPSRAPVRVFLGHPHETGDSQGKTDLVAKFFQSPSSDSWRCDLLAEHDVRFVYFGPREMALGSYDPAQTSCLHSVFQNEEVRIYEYLDRQ
jgi:hypothetical protein